MISNPETPSGTDSRPQLIGVGGGDDAVSRIQLAARWAEAFAPASGDSLRAVLARFRSAYEYLDAVTHGVEPPPDGVEDSPEQPA